MTSDVTSVPDYRVRVSVGSHVYDVTYGDEPEFGVTLPITVGWQVPESVDFFPAQADPTTGSFGLVVESVAEVTDLKLLDPVIIDIHVPATDPTPWQHVVGVVSQVQAQVGARNRLTVYFTDPLLVLSSRVVGLGDWPEEQVQARVARLCTEAGVTLDWQTTLSSSGWLPARAKGPTDALSEIRACFTDDADKITYADYSTVYGRPVYTYSQATNTLFVRVWSRAVGYWPATLGADGSLHRIDNSEGALDGCVVPTGGDWSRLPIDLPTYVIVDGLTFGDPTVPGAVPYVRSTRYTDHAGGSATARDTLGRSLVPPETSAVAWRTDTLRHLSYLEPEPVKWWFGSKSAPNPPAYDTMPWAWYLRPVIVEPVAPALTLDGKTWIAGTLSGARFTLPPGGKHYVEVTLRPDLFETNPYVSPDDPLHWDDVAPTLTWDTVNPELTWNDLNLAGG